MQDRGLNAPPKRGRIFLASALGDPKKILALAPGNKMQQNVV